jgi:hypothetical protein
MNEQETIEDIIAEMRFHSQQNIDAEKDKPEYGILTAEGRIAQNYADRLEAAHKRQADSIHRAMVILAGIEMPNPDDPPRLWTALEDAYDALSDALGTEGDTTADEEEARANGRHFVIQPHGDCAKLREALENLYDQICHGETEQHVAANRQMIRAALSAPPRNCDKYANRNDAMQAFEAFVREQGKLGFINPYTEAFRWLFATATEGGDK